ncbi:D-methionine transport system permease protein MetI [Sporotomaculum syntrophicum]|uniref:D-methionine transport system permease protein MetI n=1 Tax=Sporotomaculum syntrophicum TaxID=182264 RepID=A0A9D2WNE6_9FIRM|nr:methionine ABC transporter permease [Sporotomaculum syntrophicum]KAF1084398.1 D-methionine transport system permease protein MetI [Sporotomaculum syntrophicum]
MLDAWLLDKLLFATWETIYMVLTSTVLSYLFGLPLGVILVITAKGHIMERIGINRVLGWVINATRSVPFIIFLILLIPLTRLIAGTYIGTVASIVPLTLAAIPFVARMVETSLKEIEWGLIEAALSMGASTWTIISQVLLPEAKPSLILGVAITTINLVGYSAMAGIVGGGGLGTLAYYYGYQRYENSIMWATVIVLIILVQGVQMLGDNLAGKVAKKRR